MYGDIYCTDFTCMLPSLTFTFCAWFLVTTSMPFPSYSVTLLLCSLVTLSPVTFLLACENIRFSSLIAAGDVSRGGTSATQRQKFHSYDANQCLLNKSGSHGVPKANLFNFTFLLVHFGKVLCSSANELQQNSNGWSREGYIPQILTVLLEILRVYICSLWPFVFCLSFVNNS